jgi:4a-hydroxytetrahydrobiopterin dehydratase
MEGGMPTPLTSDAIADALLRLPGWSGGEKGIERRIEFEDFPGALQFMQACVEGIQQRNHHPVWTNKFNVVEIHLDTFDEGRVVTEKDIDLAQFFEAVLAEYGSEFRVVD